MNIVPPTKLNKHKLQHAEQILATGAAKHAFVGSVALVTRHGRIALHSANGFAALFPNRERMRTSTLFDLASVTKVVATTTSIMILIEERKLGLDQRVGEILASFSKEPARTIRVKHLLTHTSGLLAWSNFYTRHHDQRSIVDEIGKSTKLISRPGTKATYSDLDFIVLGSIVEEAGGHRLDRFSSQRIFQPLGMHDTCFNPTPSKDGVAATEFSNWRYRFIRGEVHDENAAATDGVSGHAGLFSTARDLTIFCRMILNGGIYAGTRILSKKSVKHMTTNQTQQLQSYFGLGWWIKTTGTPHVGQHLSSKAFGHNGYTGTSIWIDPTYALSIVLLTNRIHPVREGLPDRDGSVGIMMDRKLTWSNVQQQFHNAVISAMR